MGYIGNIDAVSYVRTHFIYRDSRWVHDFIVTDPHHLKDNSDRASAYIYYSIIIRIKLPVICFNAGFHTYIDKISCISDNRSLHICCGLTFHNLRSSSFSHEIEEIENLT